MTRRGWLGAAAGIAAVVGALALYDALIESDEERVERLVEDVAGPVVPARVAAATARWVDLSRQPLGISALGESLRYGPGDEEAFEERRRRGLAPLSGDQLRVLTHGVEIDGDEARVTMRVLGDRLGMSSVEWTLRRRGDDWLVSRLRVTR